MTNEGVSIRVLSTQASLREQLAADVERGFAASPKMLCPKYFYDVEGSANLNMGLFSNANDISQFVWRYKKWRKILWRMLCFVWKKLQDCIPTSLRL